MFFVHVQELKPLLNDHAMILTKLNAKYRSDQRNVNTKCINMPQTAPDLRLECGVIISVFQGFRFKMY